MFKYCGEIQYFMSESETVVFWTTVKRSVVQKTFIDTLLVESRPQKVIAEWAGCLQRALFVEGWLEGESVVQKAPQTGRMATGLSDKGSFIRSRMRLESVNQAHHAQDISYKCHIHKSSEGQYHKHLTGAKGSWFVAQWPKVSFSEESNACILIWNQGPRVRRKVERHRIQIQCDGSAVSDDLG